MEKCRVCDIGLNELNWFESLKNKNSKLCKSCSGEIGKAYRKLKPERARVYSKKYYKNHPKYNVLWGRKNRIEIRKEMISAYGGKCSACGIENFIVLDIDHINNDGGKDRKKGMWGWRLYRWLRRNKYPKDNYQLLCRNCNWIKEMQRRKGL
jgi:hypothetical protein